MSNTVTFTGTTMHLEGTLPRVGDKAPDFSLADGELKPRGLGDYSGRVLVLVCVPSLDTPVCDMEVRRFNKEAAGLSDKVVIAAVSRDLPFAQARWCGAAGVKAVETDVMLTRDGVAVISHDHVLGRAVASDAAVADLTLTDLRELDAGIRFGAAWRGEKVPLLTEVIDFALSHGIFPRHGGRRQMLQ